ncbi:MAG: NAD(P)H-binding protein [Comamonadaceae bacterium]|nr:NAD(P)H-binding protein [Comamonadaceae bacterium]
MTGVPRPASRIALAPGRRVFVTGGTGYIGRRLIPALAVSRHRVTALARPGREAACSTSRARVTGDALDAASYRERSRGGHPGASGRGRPLPVRPRRPSSLAVDLAASVRAALAAAQYAGVGHFLYLSVAQPAPVMQAYVAARAQGEALIRAGGIAATFLRPWYVLAQATAGRCCCCPPAGSRSACRPAARRRGASGSSPWGRWSRHCGRRGGRPARCRARGGGAGDPEHCPRDPIVGRAAPAVS